MTLSGRARTAAARAKRTRSKHERWIRELSDAGYSVVQAGRITLVASAAMEDETRLVVECDCDVITIGEWETEQHEVEVPLSQVLHAVNSHVCEERS